MREGQRILVSGMEDGVNGSHVANSVQHSFTPSGLGTVIGPNRDGKGQDFTKLFDAATKTFISLEPGQLLGDLLSGTGRMIAGLPRTIAPLPAL